MLGPTHLHRPWLGAARGLLRPNVSDFTRNPSRSGDGDAIESNPAMAASEGDYSGDSGARIGSEP